MNLPSTPGISSLANTPMVAEPQSMDATGPDSSQLVIAGPAQAIPIPEDERKSELAASEMQLWWREGSGATGYQNVAVLLVKWTDELDQLKCGDEVQRLDKLFQESFLYTTKICELDNATNVQLQLTRAMVEFIQQHDGPDNLIIVYYTGHGSHHNHTDKLILHPTNKVTDSENKGRNEHPSIAAWEDAETHLVRDAKCDVLSILDCCFAGDVHKGGVAEDDRTYQLLSAAGRGQKTKRPGPNSFTTALIRSLSRLLVEHDGHPFTTLHLHDHIRRQMEKNPPCLWHRLHRFERTIFLAPLKARVTSAPGPFKPSAAFLTLRVALAEEGLKKEQVKTLGKKITKAAKDSSAGVRRVDLVSYSVSTRKWSLLKMVQGAVRFRRSVPDLKSPLPSQHSDDLPATPNSDMGFTRKTRQREATPGRSARKRVRLSTPTSVAGGSPGPLEEASRIDTDKTKRQQL